MRKGLTRINTRLLSIIILFLSPVMMLAQVTFTVDSVSVYGVSSLERYYLTEPYLDDFVDGIIEYGPALHIYGMLNNQSERPLILDGSSDDTSDLIGVTAIINYNVNGRKISQKIPVFNHPRQVHHGKTTLEGIEYRVNYIAPGETSEWDIVFHPYQKIMEDISKVGRQALLKQGIELESQLKSISTNITVDIGGIIKY